VLEPPSAREELRQILPSDETAEDAACAISWSCRISKDDGIAVSALMDSANKCSDVLGQRVVEGEDLAERIAWRRFAS